MNTIRYEYEDSNSNSSFAGSFFKQEPTFMDNFDTYFPMGFDLTQHHVDASADTSIVDGAEWEPIGSLEHMITDFSPADLNLELLTDSLLLEAEEESRQQRRHELQSDDGQKFAPSTSASVADEESYSQPLRPSTAYNQQRQDSGEYRPHEFDCQPSTSSAVQADNEQAGNIRVDRSTKNEVYDMESRFMYEDVSFGYDDSQEEKSGREELGDEFDEGAEEELDDDDPEDDEDETAAAALSASENIPPGEIQQHHRKPSQSKAASQRRVTRDEIQTARKDYAKRIEEPQMAGGYVKPSYSYSCLITLALKNSGNGELTVSEIYAFLCEHFPYFRAAPSGWKNSVRHNLSLNKSFQKIEVETPGCHGRKSCLWRLNPNKVMKMEQELRKWRDRSESLILSAMRSPSADNLDAIQSGRMGMPASVRRRATALAAAAAAAAANANVTRNNSSSSGFSTSTAGSPYINQSKSIGMFSSGCAQSITSTGPLQQPAHQPKVIRRVIAAGNGAIDFDDFDGAASPATSSSSSSCSPSTARLRLSGSGAPPPDGSTEGTSGSGDTPPGGGGGKLLHRQAARKLDYLLQQKSATIFNPSKELFAAPNAAAIALTPPGKRLALNITTPSRSPLSTLNQSDLKSRRRDLLVNGESPAHTPSTVTTAVKRLSGGGYSILINRQTSSNAEEGATSSPKRFRPTTVVGGYGSAIKSEPDDLQRQNRLLRQQQQQLSSPYRNVHNDENLALAPQQHSQQQKIPLQQQKPYEIGVRSPFRSRLSNITNNSHFNNNINNNNNSHNNNNNNNVKSGGSPFQISSASFRLSETSNLSPSRRALIKERQQRFAAQSQAQLQTPVVRPATASESLSAFATATDAICNNSLL